MIAGAQEAGFTCPVISHVNGFFVDCRCNVAKKNRRKRMKWGKTEDVLPEDNACAVDLYCFGANSLCELTILSDRGGEFAELSAHMKDHVKTASYHPEQNGKTERMLKEPGMMCRLHESKPPAVVELWRCRPYGVL